jgi:hypothetical protein
VTIGTNGNLVVQGDTTLGDNAALDTVTLNGPTTFESTGIFKKGIALGAGGTDYGDGTKVLTSSGAAGTPPTWETPTTGIVTSITGDYGITVAGTAAVPTIAVTTDTNNLINQATTKATPVGADTILINDSAASDVLKKATLTSIKTFTAESWLLDVDGGTAATISDGDQVGFNSGTGIVQTLSTKDVSTALRYDDSDNSGTIKNFIEAATTAAPGTGDFLIFGDQAGGSAINSVKKATISDIVALGDQGLPAVLAINNTTGGTNIAVSAADDITFTDTSKAKFGDGGDFTIQYDGSNAIIQHVGPGNVQVLTAGVFEILNQGGAETIATFTEDGNCELYYQDTKKFETTSTGVSVTGALSTSTSASIGTTLTTGGSITVNTSGLLSITGGNNLTLSGTAASHSGLIFATNSILPAVVSVDTNGVVDLGQNGNQFKDLYLSGNVIHGGSGTGTKGGTFNKLFTSVAGGSVAFTIVRATSGAMVFDVMMTSDTSNACSIAKKFTVVKQFGVDPVVYKILDTGPDTTVDFTPVFAQDTTDTSIKCTITPNNLDTQKIGITIDLGFGNHDATVVMN